MIILVFVNIVMSPWRVRRVGGIEPHVLASVDPFYDEANSVNLTCYLSTT